MSANDKKMRVATHDKPAGVEFAIGATAAVGAGFFTNPIDVVKIRLQLQGELEARGTYTRAYRNTFHAAYQIARHEGLLALQSGLVTALGFQVVLNGTRLGSYNLAKRYELIVNEAGDTNVFKTATISGIAGCVGAVLGSPLYLVKTQLQSQSAKSIAVGHQHNHSGTMSAFRTLWREGGVKALYRGWYANIPRVFVGSATQLTTFGLFSDWLRPMEMFTDKPIFLTFVASLMGGSCVALTMQPFDVVATRLYNQGTDAKGRGSLYNGLFDALYKIFRTEGVFGLYKGVFPTWMRITPHTVLCLVFYEKIARFLGDSDPTAAPTMELAIGAVAALCAGFFTNPIDVVKIRLQLQGELEARGSYRRIYRNTFHAAYLIAKHEGVFALQAGLAPALGFQMVLNGIRIGGYNLAKNNELTLNEAGQVDVLRSLLVSGGTGCIGSAIGSPLYLVKTQLQSQAPSSIAVGTQHNHASTMAAFRELWRQGGLKGIYRGWHVGVPRISVGSATQLTTYSVVADHLKTYQIFHDKPMWLTFFASLVGGTCVAVTMQPFDVVATRVYNQRTDAAGKGVLYTGLFDAFYKILKTEGITGLYKGVFPTWLRIAPHTVLCLVFYEKFDQFFSENFR
ncbi:brain mitochondrial carrier protein 1-like [Trichogramma pretiosum]|uniref:brain mitochondrial carrier protein 1-like n=1 Tax=Trichogramma pretiosum TaxID=7493 RepID=UPI000C71A427|nr:brain mitochondrial carrier protein 1-like [Trichogramma pretiosum]